MSFVSQICLFRIIVTSAIELAGHVPPTNFLTAGHGEQHKFIDMNFALYRKFVTPTYKVIPCSQRLLYSLCHFSGLVSIVKLSTMFIYILGQNTMLSTVSINKLILIDISTFYSTKTQKNV